MRFILERGVLGGVVSAVYGAEHLLRYEATCDVHGCMTFPPTGPGRAAAHGWGDDHKGHIARLRPLACPPKSRRRA